MSRPGYRRSESVEDHISVKPEGGWVTSTPLNAWKLVEGQGRPPPVSNEVSKEMRNSRGNTTPKANKSVITEQNSSNTKRKSLTPRNGDGHGTPGTRSSKSGRSPNKASVDGHNPSVLPSNMSTSPVSSKSNVAEGSPKVLKREIAVGRTRPPNERNSTEIEPSTTLSVKNRQPAWEVSKGFEDLIKVTNCEAPYPAGNRKQSENARGGSSENRMSGIAGEDSEPSPAIIKSYAQVQNRASSEDSTANAQDPNKIFRLRSTAQTNYSTKPPTNIRSARKLLRSYLKEARKDHEYFVKYDLRRARTFYERGCNPHRLAERSTEHRNSDAMKGFNYISQADQQNTSPFAHLKPIQVLTSSLPPSSKGFEKTSQEVYPKPKIKSKEKSGLLSVPTIRYDSKAPSVPYYKTYTSLQRNILIENNRELLVLPYLDDDAYNDVEKAELWNEIDDNFIRNDKHREDFLLRKHQRSKYTQYVESFLQDLGLEWENILHHFLSLENHNFQGTQTSNEHVNTESHSNSDNSDSDSSEAVEGRERPQGAEMNRWSRVLASINRDFNEKVEQSKLASEAFHQELGQSLWAYAKHSQHAQHLLAKATSNETAESDSSRPTYRDFACRICHIHNCLYHGEYREYRDDPLNMVGSYKMSKLARGAQNVSRSAEDETFVEFDDGEQLNFRKFVTIARSNHNDEEDDQGRNVEVSKPAKAKGKALQNQSLRDGTLILEKRRFFYPCNHEGSCEESHCSCFLQRVMCEKLCGCSAACHRRFRGCNCAKSNRACSTAACVCNEFNRECDEDLCGNCGVTEILDPVNRYNNDIVKGKCKNCFIQRNVPRRLLLGQSQVQGFGLFAGENVEKDGFLGEYTGEILSKGEANRRGIIYPHNKTNYLFDLNRDQDVDSTTAGNKLRFLNHGMEDEDRNCYCKTRMCNGILRVGLFARRPIKAGEELYFNYNYPPEITDKFWSKDNPQTKPKQTKKVSKGKAKRSGNAKTKKGKETVSIVQDTFNEAQTPDYRSSEDNLVDQQVLLQVAEREEQRAAKDGNFTPRGSRIAGMYESPNTRRTKTDPRQAEGESEGELVEIDLTVRGRIVAERLRDARTTRVRNAHRSEALRVINSSEEDERTEARDLEDDDYNEKGSSMSSSNHSIRIRASKTLAGTVSQSSRNESSEARGEEKPKERTWGGVRPGAGRKASRKRKSAYSSE